MPTISMFYGIIIRMYFEDNEQHHLPHIHAEYAEHEAVIDIQNGEVLEGTLPIKKLKMVQAWVAIHEEDLMADWKLAIEHEHLFKIAPLN